MTEHPEEPAAGSAPAPQAPAPAPVQGDAARTVPVPADTAHRALRERRLRLRDRVRSQPQRLDLREELAAAYRAEGNAAQAGRWGYLSTTPDAEETAAFRRVHRDDPVEIMHLLRWTGSEDDAATDVARERLREVRAEAQAAAGRELTWERPRATSGSVPTGLELVFVLLVVGLLALAVVGAVTVVGRLTGRG